MLSLAEQHQASGARCHFLEETNSELGLVRGARIGGREERKGKRSGHSCRCTPECQGGHSLGDDAKKLSAVMVEE